MASTAISFSTTTSSPSPRLTSSSPSSSSSSSSHFPSSSHPSLCFRFSSNSNLPFFSKDLQQTLNRSVVVKAEPKEVWYTQWFSFEDIFSSFRTFVDMLLGSPVSLKVSVDGLSNAASVPPSTPGVQPSESKDVKAPIEPSSTTLATSESISEFISQVANLVKLVDSRDIVELQLKQLDCELSIRKKEALPQPPTSTPPTMIHSPPPVVPQTPMAPAPVPSPVSVSAPPPAPSALASQPAAADSSLPALKCPMAGTFYRSSVPAEPPFVKKGDKVQKGQVMCIIEAMKLMNEIEADQSGTVVDILVEDGKPVSVDTPLFIIRP